MNVQLETGDLSQTSDGPVIILEDLNIIVDPSNLPSSSSAPIENSLPEEGRNDVSDINLDVNGILPDISISEDILQSVMSDISNNNHQIEYTALTLSDTSNSCNAKDNSHVQPDQQMKLNTKFHMFSKFARLDNTFHVGDTIKVVSTTVDVGVQTEDEATGYRSLPCAKCYIMGEQRASQLSLSHSASGLISMLRAAPIHRSTETRHVSFMINKNSKD